MQIKPIDGRNVVVPENRLDRDIIHLILTHMKPSDDVGYWDVKSSATGPIDSDDWDGRVWVSWERDDDKQARQFDPFSLCQQDNGTFRVFKMPKSK